MQQAYVLAFTHLSQFEGGARFSTWLIRIAVNEALQRLRRRHRLVAIGEDGAIPEDGIKRVEKNEPNPEQRACGRELGRLLELTVDELPDLYRTVFMLREIERLEARLDSQLGEAFAFHAPRCDRVVAGVLARIGADRH